MLAWGSLQASLKKEIDYENGIRAISILAVLAFVLAVNPMVYAKGTELTYEEMVLSNTYPTNTEVTREIELEQRH